MGRLENEFRIRVTGARELRKLAKQAADKGAVDAIKKANKDAAELVANYARESTVPVKSGDLKASIKTSGTLRSALVRAGSTKITGDYAGVVHFGDPHRGIEPQMFLSDAVHDKWPEVYEFYKQEIQRVADTLRTE